MQHAQSKPRHNWPGAQKQTYSLSCDTQAQSGRHWCIGAWRMIAGGRPQTRMAIKPAKSIEMTSKVEGWWMDGWTRQNEGVNGDTNGGDAGMLLHVLSATRPPTWERGKGGGDRPKERNRERKEGRTRDGGGSKSKSDGGWGVGGGPVGVPCANMIDNGTRACVCIRYVCVCIRTRIRLMKLSVTAIRHTKTSVVVTVIKTC